VSSCGALKDAFILPFGRKVDSYSQIQTFKKFLNLVESRKGGKVLQMVSEFCWKLTSIMGRVMKVRWY